MFYTHRLIFKECYGFDHIKQRYESTVSNLSKLNGVIIEVMLIQHFGYERPDIQILSQEKIDISDLEYGEELLEIIVEDT